MSIKASNLAKTESRKLYLVPSLDKDFGQEWSHPKFSASPSPLSELPSINTWSKSFILAVIEIWAGKRPVIQISRNSHRLVSRRVNYYSNKIQGSCKIRKIYISQPIEGVSEITVTLHIGDRVRSLILRFEGVDKKWICTELQLI
jgi:hypothetical protein